MCDRYVHRPRPPERPNDGAGSRRGFTIIEVLVVLFAATVLAVLLLPAMSASRTGCVYMKDSTQVRGVLQGMVIWAQNDEGWYPLPSRVDADNATVAAEGAAKDTTSNVLSLLVYHGYVPTELFYSPQEANASIEEYRDYEFDEPSAALNPAGALWDPAFHASPSPEHNIGTGPNPADRGNNSYAVSPPTGERRALWSATYVADQAAIANRGPRIAGLDREGRPRFDKDSNTLLIHGSRDAWEGNVGYNDNHVNFETRLDPEHLTYTNVAGDTSRDVLFYDEPDDPAELNACLGVWTVVGQSPEGRAGWWD